MKKFLVFTVALLAMVAFASMALAQAPPKTEKPAAPPPGPAPEKAAPAKVEKPKAAKPPKPITGIVSAYEAGKTIAVKVKDKEVKFDLAADAKIKGEVKPGAKVTVAYKKEGDKMIATSVTVAPPPKKKEAPPKEAPLKEAPKK